MSKLDMMMGLLTGRRIIAQVVREVVGTPSMYLYGTPSESGNIGLRSGDTVTYYDGAVLPKLPEWDSVPYVAIAEVESSSTSHVCYYSSCPIIWSSDGYVRLATVEPNRMYTVCQLKDGTWNVREPKECTAVDGQLYSFQRLIWANHDIPNYDGSEIKFAKSADPIPVTGLVGYSYNGVVLPELPEWDTENYPDAILTESTRFRMWTMNGAWCGLGTDGSEWRVKCNAYVVFRYYSEDGWAKFYTTSSTSDICEIESVLWANFDILNEDGTTYLSASDPIPVYE